MATVEQITVPDLTATELRRAATGFTMQASRSSAVRGGSLTAEYLALKSRAYRFAADRLDLAGA